MSADPHPSLDPARSGDLVRRAKEGDRAAFDDLVTRSQERLVRLVRGRLGADLRRFEESGDLVQSVLVEAVRDLPRFEYRGEGSFLRWLSTIVEHKIKHHVRDLHRDKRDPARVVPVEASDDSPGRHLISPDPSPSAAAAGLEMEERYRRAIESVDEHDRELLLLHLDLGCSHGEIAEALSMPSPDAVRKRIARALVRLEREMHGSEGQ